MTNVDEKLELRVFSYGQFIQPMSNKIGEIINYSGNRELEALKAQQLAYAQRAQQQNAEAWQYQGMRQGYNPFAGQGAGLQQGPTIMKRECPYCEATFATTDQSQLVCQDCNRPKIFIPAGTKFTAADLGGKIQPKEEKKMFSFYSSMKEYVKRHGDIIFTAMFIMAADKFFFNGALKGALQRLMEKLLNKADLHLDKTEIGK